MQDRRIMGQELPYTLRVDFLADAALRLPGRLGLTRAPGRWAPARSLDSDTRLREDLEALAATHGARTLVTLVEAHELAELGDLASATRAAGLRWFQFPIADMWAPSDMAAARRLVARVLRALGRGNVVVHCWGGLGRAGTIAACCLVARGMPPALALAAVRAARPGAVEAAVQERFVHEFAARG